MSAPTIHNKAEFWQIAKTVLMPGDPKRASFIAETYLKNASMVNDTRCAYAYTGEYKGKKVSVMASGMGAGSMGIYSRELYDNYGVERIIRIGSAGGLSPTLNLGDVVLALSCSSDSGFARHLELSGDFAPTVSENLLNLALMKANEAKIDLRIGSVFSGVAFHYPDHFFQRWAEMGMLAVEMECAALYTNAAICRKEALTLLTISDMLFGKERLTTEERETTLHEMISLALEIAIS